MRAIGLVWLVGCGAGGAGVDTAGTDTTACGDAPEILWLAESRGETLIDGAAVTMVHGPDDGWHVSVEAGVRSDREVRVLPSLTLVSTGTQIAGRENDYDLRLAQWDAATCEGSLTGVLAYIDEPRGADLERICGLAGERMVLTLQLDDPAGATTASVEVVAQADPSDDCG